MNRTDDVRIESITWKCTRCHKSDRIEYDSLMAAYEIAEILQSSHKKLSPRCHPANLVTQEGDNRGENNG